MTEQHIEIRSQIIDLVAKAIIGPWNKVPDNSKYTLQELRDVRWEMATIGERGIALCSARAAVEAMREPTDEMIEAAFDGTSLEAGSSAYGCWQDMIDAALAPAQAEPAS